MAAPVQYNFSDLLAMGRSELRVELVETVSELCIMHEEVAYIRVTSPNKDEYIDAAGHRDALNEKKWLIMKLMEDAGA